MAFEAFLTQEQARPKRGRRITNTASLVFHAVLLVVAVIYSFWHVEELTPPTVTVTLMSAPPPPPPPPPPPKRRSSSTKPKTQPTEITQPKPDQIVQPRDEPPPVEEPEEDDGVEGGVEGGVKGGVVGGVIGGMVAAAPAPPPPPPAAPKMLPPTIGAKQLLTDSEADRPHLPDAFKRVGTVYIVMAKICVAPIGSVTNVHIIKGADPLIDENVVTAVQRWRFRPFTVNNNPVPFCYVSRFEFTTKQ